MDQEKAAGAPGSKDLTGESGAVQGAQGNGGGDPKEKAAGAPGSSMKKGVAVSFKCVVKCHYKGRLCRVGDVIVSDEPVPDHFEKIN